MKTLELADVSRLPEELKSGETIALLDKGRLVAHVYPSREKTIEEPAADGNGTNKPATSD